MLCLKVKLLFVLSWILNFIGLASGTDIGTFADRTCSRSLENLRGPNGYPDGYCTALNLNKTQSFQIVGLDKGCSVTIYGSDEVSGDPCASNAHQMVAEIARCYNSSWVYYSIDGCDIPVSIPPASSSFTDQPTSTPNPTSSSSSGPPDSGSRRTGALVGGIVGGVAGLALIFTTAIILTRRRQRKNSRLPPLPDDFGPPVAEIEPRKPPQKGPDYELYAHEAAAELGRNSAYIAAELQGDTVESPGKNEKSTM